MLFNSIGFIFLFLPIALAGYYFFCATPLRAYRFAFLSVMSMVFYAEAAWSFAALLAFSTAANLFAARLIQRLRDAGREHAMLSTLRAGIVLNLLFLCYFKYLGFLAYNVNVIAGIHLPVPQIALPIGISFYTFLFMGTLVDVARGNVKCVVADRFVSFSLFFPHLLAGPLVHYQELVPQIVRRPWLRNAPGHLAIGLPIFAIGLFKKTVMADTLALYNAPVFTAADDGLHPGMASSWLAALGFMLQIYFDFSGYSDMAIGLARMFGFKLPLNFHSPLRAGNIVDYWRRWHMTLQRFIVAYLFPSIAIPLARLSVRRQFGDWADFAAAVATPTIITFLVLGLWHGAGWNYILFGAMNGVYITVCEAWRKLRRRGRWRKVKPRQPEIVSGRLLTLLAVVLAHAVFRSRTLAGASRILGGLVGLGGENLPAPSAALGLGTDAVLVALGYLFVSVAPNTQQIMGRYDPALNWSKWRREAPPVLKLAFRPTIGWAVAIGLILFTGVIFIERGEAEFIYFQF